MDLPTETIALPKVSITAIRPHDRLYHESEDHADDWIEVVDRFPGRKGSPPRLRVKSGEQQKILPVARIREAGYTRLMRPTADGERAIGQI